MGFRRFKKRRLSRPNVCPECGKGVLQKQVGTSGILFKKVLITYYCPICSFRRDHIFNRIRK